MIISRTPYRISFFGGGTDYPTWYLEHGGAVIATTIDKYCYINCRYLPPFFEHKHRIVYSKIETIQNLDEIHHPAVRAILKEFRTEQGLEIHHDGDLPARSGVGSSSAFVVGLLNALNALRGERIAKDDLAKQAIRIEQNVIKETVGSQDQISCAYGGLNRIDFKKDGSFTLNPIIMKHEKLTTLQDSLLLFFTGISRTASDVAKTKVENFKNRTTQLQTIQHMVEEANRILESGNSSLDEFGKLLHEGWELKRSLSASVSNAKIDEIYSTARAAGALGGKILGAGGGGFILFYVKPEHQKQVKEKLKGLLHVAFKFETAGSHIALYEPSL